MKYEANIASLTSIAEWCRAQYRHIVTAKTRKPVKVPKYIIVRCDECSLLTLQKVRQRSGPTGCQDQKVSRDKTRSTSRPKTRICNSTVTIVKEIGSE